MLRSVDDIVDALGGTTAVAELVGAGLSAISNWKFRGSIPPEHFLTITEALDERNLSAAPAIFGFKVAAE